MRTPRLLPKDRRNGFSLVELTVALLFTLILMGGMATVFKASLGSFVTAGEKLSGSRRNRLAMEMLQEDINIAGQYLVTLEKYPAWVEPGNSGFWIEPGATASSPDQLHLAFDDALPFEALLIPANGGGTTTLNNLAVNNETAMSNYASGFSLKVRADQAAQVKPGMVLIIKDYFEPKEVATATATDDIVAITTKEKPQNAAGGATGTTGTLFDVAHRKDASVVVVKPSQQVRYKVVPLSLDTENPDLTIPCLVREQSNYGTAYASSEASYTTTIIAENVANFKITLSLDNGLTWLTGISWAEIQTKMDAVLALTGRDGFKAVTGNANWYRDVPAMVKVDVTTQTAKARTEYSASADTLARKTQTRTMVLLPRYFGLSYYQ